MNAKPYQPPFTFTSPIVASVSRISERLGAWSARSETTLSPMLRRGNRIRTIQASLAIEHNTLSVEQVSAMFDGKPVLGPPREVQEVRNAIVTYERLPHWRPTNEHHLLDAHALLMAGLMEGLGRYRAGGVGIYDGDLLVHMAPPADRVPYLMRDLFAWLAATDLPPLVASCLFHYEFEFIHPFADGNGRMGRLWQTLILSQWRPELAWLPVETVVRERQREYYAALAQADAAADSTPFVVFMLEALEQALTLALEKGEEVSEGVSDGVNPLSPKLDELDQQLMALMAQAPHITQQALMEQCGRSLSTIQRHIRKLRSHGLIERVGSDKSGHWKVKG